MNGEYTEDALVEQPAIALFELESSIHRERFHLTNEVSTHYGYGGLYRMIMTFKMLVKLIYPKVM